MPAGRPLRILAIAPTGFYADYGCHVRIRGQMAALASRGHTVHVATYPGGREVGLATSRPPFPARWRDLPVGSSRRKLLLDLLLTPVALSASKRLRGGRPDVIHAYLHEGALIGAALSWLTGAPVVFDFQGSLTAEMLDHRFLSPRSPLVAPVRWLEGWIDRRPASILASSQHAAALLVQQFAVLPQRVATLADSVDPELFRPARSRTRAIWPRCTAGWACHRGARWWSTWVCWRPIRAPTCCWRRWRSFSRVPIRRWR